MLHCTCDIVSLASIKSESTCYAENGPRECCIIVQFFYWIIYTDAFMCKTVFHCCSWSSWSYFMVVYILSDIYNSALFIIGFMCQIWKLWNIIVKWKVQYLPLRCGESKYEHWKRCRNTSKSSCLSRCTELLSATVCVFLIGGCAVNLDNGWMMVEVAELGVEGCFLLLQ